jgi:hypothetical protein
METSRDEKVNEAARLLGKRGGVKDQEEKVRADTLTPEER